MSEARSAILARIAAANGRSPDAAMPEAVRARLEAARPGPQPAWTEPHIERFIHATLAAAATLDRVRELTGAADSAQAFLRRQGVDPPVVLAPHPLLRALTRDGAETRPLQPSDRAAMTVAYGGIAETGSLALLSSPETPTGLNFLPEYLICLLDAAHVVAHLDDLWRLIRRQPGALPRAVNLVTGPSRTADVEQTIQLGAHGPRQVHVVLLEREG